MKVENDVNVLHEEGPVAVITDEMFISAPNSIMNVKLEVSVAFKLFL
jgi:hypothetical protein